MKPTHRNSRAWRTALPGLVVSCSMLLLVVLLLSLLLLSHGGQLRLPQRIWQTLAVSLGQATLSTAVSLSVGLVLAWALSHRRQFIGRQLLLSLLSVSLVLPTLVIVLGLVSVFGRAGWINDGLAAIGTDWRTNIYGLGGIVLAHSYFNGAFSARQLLLQLEAIPPEKRKLAHSLGISGWKRFKLLEWPAVAGSIPQLAVTIFLLCFTSFAIVLVLGGSPKYNTLEVAIFEALKLDFNPARAVAIALLQLAICAVLVLVANALRSNSTSIASAEAWYWPESLRARSLQWLIIGGASTLLSMPLLAVIFDGLQADLWRLSTTDSVQRAIATSLLVALLSATTVVIISLLIVRTQTTLNSALQLGTKAWASSLNACIGFSATLYLAVPSLVLGLGFFLAARRLPGSLEVWAGVALVTANVLMALPFALALLLPPAQKAAHRYQRLVISLDLQGWRRWRMVEWPLLRRSIAQVAALSFCLSLGDLGVIALFGNHDLATLPWLLYQNFGSYRTQDAAGLALILLTMTLLVFSLLPKVFQRGTSHA